MVCAIEIGKIKTQQKIEKELWEVNDPDKIKERMTECEKGVYDKGYYEKKLEIDINTICRLIDKNSKCISCNGIGDQAGHRHSVGSNCSLRYDLHNLHMQDYNCNGPRSSNDFEYKKGLAERYGKEYQEYVDTEIVRLYPSLNLKPFELKEAITKARIIIKRLKRENKEYSFSERIELRNKLNLEIGLYNSVFNN